MMRLAEGGLLGLLGLSTLAPRFGFGKVVRLDDYWTSANGSLLFWTLFCLLIVCFIVCLIELLIA